jgi:hypothetical protein
VFIIHGKEERGEHDKDHANRMLSRCPLSKKKAVALREGCRKAKELPFGQVKYNFVLTFDRSFDST